MTTTANVPSIQKGTYRHNKSGNLYKVLGVALETETDEPVVVYRPLYDHEFGYELFTRPYTMFTDTVELSGEKKLRFEYVGD